jgi:hypothetical protein
MFRAYLGPPSGGSTVCIQQLVLIILVRFNETWTFPADFRKMLKSQISIKSVQWEPSCSMWTDRQADMSKPIITLRYIANAAKNDTVCASHIFAGYERITIRLILQLYSMCVDILILLTINKHKITQGIHTKFTDLSDIIVGSRNSTSSRKLNRFVISKFHSTSSRFDVHCGNMPSFTGI